MEEMLFGGCRDGAFSGGGEAGEPEGEAFLFAKGVALGAGEAFVPCDVARIGLLVGEVREM
jgi:hypothetical protein